MTTKTGPYQTGEVVDITIRGAVVRTCSDRGLFVNIPGGSEFGVSLPTDADGKPVDAVAVTVTQPADGPARPGDVWRTPAGVRWFAHEIRQRDDTFALQLTTGELRGYCLAEICQVFGTPVLEYRVPEPPAVEPEPVAGRDFLSPAGDEPAEPTTDWSTLDTCPVCHVVRGNPCVAKGRERTRRHADRRQLHDAPAEVTR